MRSPNSILDKTGSHRSERYFISTREGEERKHHFYVARSDPFVNGKEQWLKAVAMEF